jgi:hypothetical protein
MQHHGWDWHVDQAIDDALDDDVDGHLDGNVSRDDPNLDAWDTLLGQCLKRAEEREEQAQE